jgi:hypothetical protein
MNEQPNNTPVPPRNTGVINVNDVSESELNRRLAVIYGWIRQDIAEANSVATKPDDQQDRHHQAA